MDPLQKLRLRRIIRSYARDLPHLLQRDYGAGRWFSGQQVTRAVERSGLSRKHLPYALLMFSDPADFARYCEQTGQRHDIVMMRRRLETARFYDTGEAANSLGPTPWAESSSETHTAGQNSTDAS